MSRVRENGLYVLKTTTSFEAGLPAFFIQGQEIRHERLDHGKVKSISDLQEMIFVLELGGVVKEENCPS